MKDTNVMQEGPMRKLEGCCKLRSLLRWVCKQGVLHCDLRNWLWRNRRKIVHADGVGRVCGS